MSYQMDCVYWNNIRCGFCVFLNDMGGVVDFLCAGMIQDGADCVCCMG